MARLNQCQSLTREKKLSEINSNPKPRFINRWWRNANAIIWLPRLIGSHAYSHASRQFRPSLESSVYFFCHGSFCFLLLAPLVCAQLLPQTGRCCGVPKAPNFIPAKQQNTILYHRPLLSKGPPATLLSVTCILLWKKWAIHHTLDSNFSSNQFYPIEQRSSFVPSLLSCWLVNSTCVKQLTGIFATSS